jgi:misacylated tRNA(Ala) deacylase
MPTELLYLRAASLRAFDATVVEADETGVVLDRTAFYVTGAASPTTPVSSDGMVARRGWSGRRGLALPGGRRTAAGALVHGEIDSERRHALMRIHTALHVLCGVIWNTWGKAVTGGDMQPLSARMDFEFDPLPPNFGAEVEELVNAELAAARPVEVSFLPLGEALRDADLIRTKVNMIPESVTQIRVVDIVGLDKQADGGTHVARTDEVGRIRVLKTESKGKGNKRIRIEVVDA